MTRFSIRELMLLTVAVALVIGWWQHARRVSNDVLALRSQISTQEKFNAARRNLLESSILLEMLNGRTREFKQRLSFPEMDRRPKPVPKLHLLLLEGNRA
jgi:hypothetical protein